jgi:hypothetical protein
MRQRPYAPRPSPALGSAKPASDPPKPAVERHRAAPSRLSPFRPWESLGDAALEPHRAALGPHSLSAHLALARAAVESHRAAADTFTN